MLTDHTPTATNQLYTCPACSFRCVVTPRGIIVTEHSTDDATHLAAIEQAAAQRRAWAERVVTRLRLRYEDQRAKGDYGAYSLAQLQRLMRWIIAEYV